MWRRRSRRAQDEPAPAAPPERSPESTWFWDHYDGAAEQVVAFLGDEGITLQDKLVADVGCGDGFIDLGVVHKGSPQRLDGFDVNLTDTENLRRRSEEEGVGAQLPEALSFRQSEATRLPADDDTYDVAITWSAFEHIAEPVGVLSEIRRILKPDGVLFLQLWPFYHSSHGSHLWDWFDDGFPNLTHHDDDVAEQVRASEKSSPEWTEYMLREYRHLNRITLDELHRCLLAGGLGVRKFELISHAVRLPDALQRYPLSQLGIAGVKLLASPL